MSSPLIPTGQTNSVAVRKGSADIHVRMETCTTELLSISMPNACPAAAAASQAAWAGPPGNAVCVCVREKHAALMQSHPVYAITLASDLSRKTAEFRLHQTVCDYVQILMKPCCSQQTTVQVKHCVACADGLAWDSCCTGALERLCCSRATALDMHAACGTTLSPNTTSGQHTASAW